MKIRKSLIALLAALPLFVVSCDKQELPYDLDGVVRTFGISVDKVTTADLLLGAGTTDGNYKVSLSVPEHMGDYTSYFKEAELLCVYTPASGDTVYSAVAATGIKTLPCEVTIDMVALCENLGITAPAIGDKMQFTTNIIHKDGTVVPGWTETMGFNFMNPTFASFSYATYSAAAPLDVALYEGLDGKTIKFSESLGSEYEASYGALVTLLTEEEITEAGVVKAGFTAADYIGLKLTYNWYAFGYNCNYCIYINKKDYSVSAPEQVVAVTDPNFVYNVMYGYGDAGNFVFYGFNGELDTQTNILTMTHNADWDITVGPYTGAYLGFGGDLYKIEFGVEL
ncbi:MAG: hypothetical protein J6Q97_04455 [Bacteroidaceae bacterium]|nr:hypothetical protein [Bacteroidaceae bacterium]